MAHTQVYPTRSGRYGTRMLKAGAPILVSGPLAREMIALGRATLEKPTKTKPQLDHDRNGEPGGSKTATGDDIAALRAEYQAKFDKRPFNGWDADTLREKIAEA